jgi:hypothetical protein
MTGSSSQRMRWLIDNSSLGSPAARRLRARTSHRVAMNIVASSTKESKTVRDQSASALHRNPTNRAVTTTPRQPESGNTPMAQRKTSPKAAKAASKVLRDGRTSKASKTAAGSALSQAAPKKKGK